MTSAASELGVLVRCARERAGLSMNDLAAAAGTSVSTISRIESGGFDPRWSTVEAVMSALGTSVDRERALKHNSKTARYRERLGNIFSAAQLVAPSYEPVELWTLLEGTTVGGKPLAEELAARRVARAYDQALAEALDRNPGTFTEAVQTGADAVAAGAPLAEGIARMAALLAVWTGRRLFIPANAKASVTSIDAAAHYAMAA
jgi:transcriptional regulator with XRE-family HTH domain